MHSDAPRGPALLGINLQPDPAFLHRTRRICEDLTDFFEISPETLWRPGPTAAPTREFFTEVRRKSGKPFAAHGLGLSPGTAVDQDGRLDAWLRQIGEDHEQFDFAWYSEHLGFCEAGSIDVTLPLPLPHCSESLDAVSRRLGRLREVVPVVALENWASTFTISDPGDEPRFCNAVCEAADCGLILDLHNVYTQCLNFDLDANATLDGFDLDRVIALHLSGGSFSEPEWSSHGRVFRLDSHDGPVPEWVWQAFARILPECRNLRGVVIERIAASLDDAGTGPLEREFERARELMCLP